MTIEHKVGMANTRNTANAAFEMIDRMQNYDPGEQVLAAAIVMTYLVERHGVNPNDLYASARRMIMHPDTVTFRPEFAAIQQYMKDDMND